MRREKRKQTEATWSRAGQRRERKSGQSGAEKSGTGEEEAERAQKEPTHRVPRRQLSDRTRRAHRHAFQQTDLHLTTQSEVIRAIMIVDSPYMHTMDLH